MYIMKGVKYGLLIVYNLIRMIIYRLISLGKIKSSWLLICSPFSCIECEGAEASVHLHKMVSISSLSTIRASGGNIDIGRRVFINKLCMVVSKEKITIGDNTTIGPGVMIYDHDHTIRNTELNKNFPHYTTAPIVIGSNVWIGANAVILKGVTIGDNSVIGAGSLINKSVEKNCVYAGNPAKLIKRLFPHD